MIENRLVVYGAEGENNGCNFYRIRQPISMLAEKDVLPCAVSSAISLEDQSLWVDKADLIVSQKMTSEKFLDYMVSMKGKQRFVIDIDDNIFSVSPYNPSYKWYGVSEVKYQIPGGGEVELKDGEYGFNIAENKRRMFILSETLSKADLITTPSSILCGRMKRLNKNVKVVKNFLDLRTWKPLNMVKDDKVRIGWQGGWSHYEDWCEIKDALKTVLIEHKNAVLVIMGTHFEGTTKDFPQDQIETVDWTDIMVYPHKFKTLGIDIGIAPIANNDFNTCKSELKWEEYSSLKIPCVASNIPPYNLSILDGNTGFLCGSKEDWVETISKLVLSSKLREEVGNRARSKIEEDYDLSKGVYQYEDIYKKLCHLKTELILH